MNPCEKLKKPKKNLKALKVKHTSIMPTLTFFNISYLTYRKNERLKSLPCKFDCKRNSLSVYNI